MLVKNIPGRRLLMALCLGALVFLAGVAFEFFHHEGEHIVTKRAYGYTNQAGTTYISRTDNQYFYIFSDGQWEKTFIKGINLGAAKPGYFPGEFGVSKKDYLRWFEYIGKMNVNTIRVYTILMPEFYQAFLEYNEAAAEPLFLLHGVWIDESDMVLYKNAYSPFIYSEYMEDIENTINVLHGNAVIEQVPGKAFGEYEADVSPYLLGLILGLEWEPEFVVSTNDNNQEKGDFQGRYLFTENASPFEIFLGETADHLIDYQMDNYQTQTPVSFTNWVTTDMLAHPNEPFRNDDLVSVNTEHIKAKENFECGLFASYHIYPYYPETMNYHKEYVSFKDDRGEINPYKAYLRDLRKEHTVPVVVAEFGIPSGRGKAHENIHTGFNQGNVSEQEQGWMIAHMMDDIFAEGYAGGLVFSFQDEWFKRTWNTMELDNPQRRPYWHNLQTNEQNFGVLAFDSGEEEMVAYLDGNYQEWKHGDQILNESGVKVFAKCDATGLYLYVQNPDFCFAEDKLFLPIDVVGRQGNSSYKGVKLPRCADFLLVIDGRENTRLLVDPYYDSFQFLYGAKASLIKPEPEFFVKDSGTFVPSYLALSKGFYTPQDGIYHPFVKYETGLMKFGKNNPQRGINNSLVDFFAEDGNVEIRIPWQLLNFMDPSSLMVMDDLHKGGITPRQIKGIHIGFIDGEMAAFGKYSRKPWKMPVYHERLKQSYFILQESFRRY